MTQTRQPAAWGVTKLSLEVPVTHLTVLITHWHLQVAGYNQIEWARERFGIRINKLNSVMIPVRGSKLVSLIIITLTNVVHLLPNPRHRWSLAAGTFFKNLHRHWTSSSSKRRRSSTPATPQSSKRDLESSILRNV